MLDSISFENNVCLTHKQREQIHKLFVEIDGVLHEVDDGRKRMMSIKYIYYQAIIQDARASLQRYQCNEVEEDIKIL